MKTKISCKFIAWLAVLLMGTVAAQAAFVGGRTDFRDESIYFVITTRFYDGDPGNNAQCWDAPSSMHGDPAWRGDFKGLIEKLDYIKALGFTAIWITPVVENASGFDYHGYHARDFSKVDHRYESDDVSFLTLIDEVHKRGMKLVLDIVLNHTGNFGEENLCKQFTRDWSANQYRIDACMKPCIQHDGGPLPDNYASLAASQQYACRLQLMKNTDNQNHDTHNYWHHFGQFNWDDNTRWYAQIAGDCVDLNTENPAVVNYLVDCYGTFIKMGVDGFRIDTGGHIPRLTFNKMFIPRFQQLAEQYKEKRGGAPFFIYTEVCARYQGSVTYRNQPVLSPYFYTWAESKDYDWSYDTTYWDNTPVYESTALSSMQNIASCEQQYADNKTETAASMPTSDNAVLHGNDYHTPDVSRASGLNVIDFPVHYSFHNIASVWNLAIDGDKYYNDATYNVVYVDSHDYSPGPNDGYRFDGGTAQWAENLDLMFTFRGIPCLYYGSEIEFRKGVVIDNGTSTALASTGRAYYGGYITGDVSVSDFGQVASASGNVAATLNAPLARHLQRLNQIREAVPALRKGQYSVEGCTSHGGYAFKRRYTDDTVDSYALVTINGSATFTGVLNGTYTDCVTGDVQAVTDGTLTTDSCSGQGNMRVYVLSTSKTPAPGKIGDDGKFLYTTSPAADLPRNYDGHEEDLSSNDGENNGTAEPADTLSRYTPAVERDEKSVFYEAPLSVRRITTWVWDASNNYTGGTWPGQSMQLMGVNADSTRKIFKWTYDDGTLTSMPGNIIFVVDGTQTSDLVYRNHGYYIDGVWNREITNVVSDAPTVSVDKAGGRYTDSVTVTLTASDPSAVIVYTTDGTMPAASSPQSTGSVTLTFTGNTTLMAGVLYEGRVRNIITEQYIFHDVQPATATIYLKDPTVAPNNWSSVYFYAWDGGISIADTWPGLAIGETRVVKGDKFYYRTFTLPTSDYTFNIIFSQGDGSHQTVDITGLSKDTYYEISSTTSKYTVTDVTSQYDTPRGDINADGVVNVTDVTALCNTILGAASYDASLCDINADGVVNVTDVTALVTLILAAGD